MEGKLVILATGSTVDNFSESYKVKGNEKIEDLIGNLENKDWHLSNSIFIENFQLFDSRNSQSKVNRLFCSLVRRALKEGANIFIVVPDANMVDKRLRQEARVFSLPIKAG